MKKGRQFVGVPLTSWPFLLVLLLMIFGATNWFAISEGWSGRTTVAVLIISNIVALLFAWHLYQRAREQWTFSTSVYAIAQERETAANYQRWVEGDPEFYTDLQEQLTTDDYEWARKELEKNRKNK